MEISKDGNKMSYLYVDGQGVEKRMTIHMDESDKIPRLKINGETYAIQGIAEIALCKVQWQEDLYQKKIPIPGKTRPECDLVNNYLSRQNGTNGSSRTTDSTTGRE